MKSIPVLAVVFTLAPIGGAQTRVSIHGDDVHITGAASQPGKSPRPKKDGK